MADLILQASDDLVARIAHEGDPVRAVAELIWNSVDAEATTVNVVLERSTSDAINQVCVEDDGHGISSDEVQATFGRIGGSWKQRSEKTKNGRRYLHGRSGEGRLRAFALGSRVRWVSVSDNTAGKREQVTISGSRNNRDRFRWEAVPSTAAATGTTAIAHNDEQRSLAALESDDVVPTLRSHFAPVLLNDKSLTITFDGSTLDPSQEIVRDCRLDVPFGEDEARTATVRIIEWRTGKHRALYFGADADHFPYETSGSGIENQLTYSAYVTCSGLSPEELRMLGLGDMAPDKIGALWAATRKVIREYFNSRRRERRREQVERWKNTGIYPYKGDPANETERAERAVFDVVSGALVPHISTTKKEAQLTLELLRDAVRHDPDKLTTILHEVVSLSESDRDILSTLLRETTLSAIIRSANMIANRHKFLAGLEHLLFDPDDSGEVGERDHLHKILEHELWIFGEGYHLMSSERGLTQLVRTHLRLEGLPTKDVVPVKRWDGKSGRVDLHLAAKYQEHDSMRHLVVELKAPDVRLTQTELNQVEGYANTVRTTSAFASDHASWDFILVGSDYDDLVDDRIHADHRATGQFLAPPAKPGRPRVRCYVRRWRELIDENERRLDFVTSVLEHDPSITEGLQYVREEYGDLLPESLLRTTSTDVIA